MLRIRLLNLPESVVITGVDGSSQVVEHKGSFYLSGRFRLKVGRFRSSVVVFAVPSVNAATVVWENETWTLHHLFRTWFPIVINCQPHRDGPWLRAQIASIQQTSPYPVVELGDPSISLLPRLQRPANGSFYYPTNESGGMEQVTLKKLAAPGIPTGYFIRGIEGRACLVWGGLIGGFNVPYISLTHVPGVTFKIYHDCAASFDLEADEDDRPSPLVFDTSAANAPHELLIDSATLLMLRRRSRDVELLLKLDILTGGCGFLTASNYRDAEVDLVQVAQSALAETQNRLAERGLPTRLYGPSERFKFHLPVTRFDTDFAAHFAYEDTSPFRPFDPANVSRRESYYGLRIRGFGSSKGLQAKLDAGLVRVALLPPKKKVRSFHFQAGKPLVIAGQDRVTQFQVVPKPNRSREWVRVLDVPANEMAVRVQAGVLVPDAESPIILDTFLPQHQLQLTSPKLIGRPVGVTSSESHESALRLVAGQQDEAYEFKEWSLSMKGSFDALNFDMVGDSTYPVVELNNQPLEWTRAFQSDPAPPFPLVHYPGEQVAIDGVTATQVPPTVSTEVTYSEDWDTGTNKERMVYTAISVAIIYKAIECIATSFDECIPDTDVKVEETNLEAPQPQNPAKRNGLGDLQLIYFEDDAGFARFVRKNSKRPSARRVFWPFAFGLSLLMREGGNYAPAIARTRKPDARPGLALDWSDSEAIDFPADFGWENIQEFARLDPTLWPRASGRTGARLDPTDPFWRGILYRDLPLALPLPPEAQNELDKLPVLKSFMDAVNGALILEYGWKDSSGTTWKGGLILDEPLELLPIASWLELISIKLKGFGTTGAENEFISCEGTLKVSLPWADVEAEGIVSYEFAGDTPTTRVVIENRDSGFFDTTAIPGFEEVRLVRFFTDFRTAQADLDMKPSPELAAAIPIFPSNKPMRAVVSYDFSGDPKAELSFLLPAEKRTRLFGIWPIVLQGMRLRFRQGGMNEVEIRGRLGLGPGGFASIDLTIILRKDPHAGWKMDVRPGSVSADIGIGGYRLHGLLSWTDEHDNGGPVPRGALSSAAGDRDFWGILQLDGGELFGSVRVFVRFGNRGGKTFWIGGLALHNLTGNAIPLGIAELKDPMLLISRDADLRVNNNWAIAELLADPRVNTMSLLRPAAGSERTWLAGWQSRPDVGNCLGASGRLKFDDSLLSEPQGDQYLTTVIRTSEGLTRVDAACNFFDVLPLRFSIILNPPSGMAASLTAPSVMYPSQSSPDFEFSGGQIVLDVDYGDKPHVEFSMGWPPLTNANPNDELERDWSQSLSVRWDEVVPINTYWGGFRVRYDSNARNVADLPRAQVWELGIAIRAGWTKTYEVGGDAAGGKADLGVAVGGVLEIRYVRDRQVPLGPPPNPQLRLTRQALRLIFDGVDDVSGQYCLTSLQKHQLKDTMRRCEIYLTEMTKEATIEISGTVYADIWGRGSASLMGVTVASIKIEGRARIHVEGSSKCSPMITKAYGYIGFDFEIKIGCEVIRAAARVDMVLVDRPCRASQRLLSN